MPESHHNGRTQERNSNFDVITGAFSYTGKYLAHRLLSMGRRLRTLTGHPDRPNPFGEQIAVLPYNFDKPGELTRSLRGATTLFNTYWVRFPYKLVTFEHAVKNTEILIRSAEQAGIRRLVHISITNASEDSPLPYFRGKGLVEKAIRQSKLSYAIIRPTVIFGLEDILINNIAWFLRRFPVFAVPGHGKYLVQPAFVDDVAAIAVAAGQRDENTVVDATGPETYSFNELVRLIADKTGSKAKITHLPPALTLFLCRFLALVVHDIVLTRDEVEGLMSNLLISKSLPSGQTRLSEWLEQHGDRVGTTYASELSRHYRSELFPDAVQDLSV